MADLEKVIKGLEICANRVPGKYDCNECPYETDGNYCEINLTNDALALLKEQEKKKFFVDSDGKITPLPVPDIVRCKDCVHRGKAEKCVLAAIAAEKDLPLFMLDNHGEWYCADGRIEEREKGDD